MKAFFLFVLTIPLIFVLTCCKEAGPTGYKAGIKGPGDSPVIKTCDEDKFIKNWWTIETDNVLAGGIVPHFADYCTFVEEDYVFFWDTEDLSGFYNYDFYWKCADKNTAYISNDETGDEIEIKIFGKVTPDCYDVQITYGVISISADLCSCEYNGP